MDVRRAVVTGGTAGIGLAVARRLRRDGHRVFICGRNAARLDAALRALQEEDQPGLPRAAGAICDVRSGIDVHKMMATAREHLGGIDVLVNNAGIAFITDFEQISTEAWFDIIQTNLTGAFNCCQAALPALKEASAQRGLADIVNVGSRSGRYSFPGGVGYNTTKFGLQGFTEALFLDLNRFGIRVGLVAPGTVATGLAGVAPAEWQLQPEDVGEAVAAMINARRGACMNWVEVRPSRPPVR